MIKPTVPMSARALGLALVSSLLLSGAAPQASARDDDKHQFHTLEWRNIGPSRGGRVQSVSGVVGDPFTYYMGATGGGVWKTQDAGGSWRNITDGFLGTGSVGDVAVSESDPNVIYVGMGEADIRGNFSHGDGVYKSEDAGATWEHIGLEDSRQIGRIAIHPTNPDIAFVAALGHVFGPNAQRGVFRTTDGGDSWERVCYVDDRTGAIDVRIDPWNPRVIYAGFWQVRRTPWSLESGGPGSGLFKSTDGGDTWTELGGGLPEGVKGKISVSPSRAQRGVVYAIIEAEDGGVFRSSNGGETWRKTSADQNLRQRAWYYTHIYADPQDVNTVYVMNVFFLKSTDGGRNFRPVRVPHVDNHDLWIDPHNNQRIINGNDGGANVSFNAGRTWSRQDNQPTAQFYHVITDNNFPYRVLGAQQDNSTASISSQNRLGRDRFHPVGGGESGYIAPRHDNPDIVYAGSYSGFLTRYDHDLGVTRNITVWPENPMGGGADVLRYRFQWTFPIVVSVHDPDVLYTAGNVVFKSTDEGGSFDAISPDLTTNDKSKQRSSGGVITKDNTGVEYYCTVFALAESPLEQGLLWAGSDDGLVHVTSDEGGEWTNITPEGMGDWPMISQIDASHHDADKAYLAVNRYKMNDFAPYIYKTTDRGQTWTKITTGIAQDAFVRVVREDPEREGLLFAGTETGVYYSMNDGESWQALQLNLPVVPITDLVIKEDDVVVSTQGRSFWILDDISAMRQWDEGIPDAHWHLFTPADAYREGWDSVRVQYHLDDDFEGPLEITFRNTDGEVVRTFRSDKPEMATPNPFAAMFGFDPGGPAQVTTNEGLNTFEWNMRHSDPAKVPGAVYWGPDPRGPRVRPGDYLVQICNGEEHLEAPFTIHADPRIETSEDEYAEQERFMRAVNAEIDRTHTAINTIRNVRKQVDAALAHARKAGMEEDLTGPAKELKDALTAIEEELIQTRSKSPQDPLNFPIKVNDKLSSIQNIAENDYAPTAQVYDVFEMLKAIVDEQLAKLDDILESDVPAFNDLVARQTVPAIILESAEEDDDASEGSEAESEAR